MNVGFLFFSRRWWIPSLVIAADALYLTWLWAYSPFIRQHRMLHTLSSLVIAIILLLIWLLVLSGISSKTRRALLLSTFLIVVAAVALFRVRGVTGDVVPILEWRTGEGRVGERAKGREGERDYPLSPNLPLTLSPTLPSPASDYPQFLGPHRNATLSGINLQTDWNAHPPKLVWRKPIGEGWSSFAVVGQHAVTQEQNGGLEEVVCYDLSSGRPLWRHSDSTRYESVVAGVGPRATPSISGNQVFTLGATGILNCLDLEHGERYWSVDILKDNHSEGNNWGISCSPLLLDSVVIVSAGGAQGRSLVAYHKDTGRFIWGGGTDRSGYSSPQLVNLEGERHIVIFNSASIAGHDRLTGRLLWEFPWPAEQPNVAQPLPLPGNRFLAASGYGVGSKVFELKRGGEGQWITALIWQSPRLKAKFANMVHRNGFVYGLDDGILICMNAADGHVQWKRGRYGHGQLLLIDDVILVQAESGEVVLVEANPELHRELARFAALDGKTWNNPALAGSYLLVRNHREAACYRLAVAQATAL